MSRVARPAHVTAEATIQQTSDRESQNNLENKKSEKNQSGVGGNILGGKRDGISRLLFPGGKKSSPKPQMGPSAKNSNLIKTKGGKQYKISDFFSSEEDSI